MQFIKSISSAAMIALIFTACQKEKGSLENANTENTIVAASDNTLTGRAGNSGRGFVYTLSNQTSGNEVLAYKRSTDGNLTFFASYATGGNGTGSGLGNQGAVVIGGDDDDNDILLAVNAGSNTISSFKINGNGSLTLRSTKNSGGTTPVSITVHENLVYVLNAGDDGNISGFTIGENGFLATLHGSVRPLSSNAAGAAQISFTANGRVLAITEKATNKIITYTVNSSGRPGMMHSITSASPTPFGFATGKFGNIYVSEAAGGAANASNVSSYHIAWDGAITLADGPNATNQSAACWVVLTNDGKHVYTTNTASGTVSSFNVMPVSGNLNLSQSVAATAQAGPIDAALSDGSKFLYVLNAGAHSISAFTVQSNGSLTALQTVSGLPTGANGLAAY